jgi:hypothetical protein
MPPIILALECALPILSEVINETPIAEVADEHSRAGLCAFLASLLVVEVLSALVGVASPKDSQRQRHGGRCRDLAAK